MAMILVVLCAKQRCAQCGQKSSPKRGEGKWEILGVWNGPIHRCTVCGSLSQIGYLFDEVLPTREAVMFLEAREEHLGP